jgi:uncharacterized membrane protein YbhN (UPF0104 family)
MMLSRLSAMRRSLRGLRGDVILNADGRDDRLRLAFHATATVVVVVAGVHFARSIDFSAVGRLLAGASLWIIAVCAAVNLFEIWLRAVAFSLLLSSAAAVPPRRLFRIALAGLAVSNVLPWPAGDLTPIALLRSCEGIPVPRAAASTLIEKYVEGIALLLLAAPLSFFVPRMPHWMSIAVLAAGIVSMALLAIAWVVLPSSTPRWLFLNSFIDGAAAVREPRILLATLGLALLQWILDSFTIWLILWSLDIHVYWAAPVLIELAVTLVMFAPSAPAHLGALEAGAVLALSLLGVSEEPSLAFAVLYRAMDMLPVTVLGLLALPSFAGVLRVAQREQGIPEIAQG